ncbi:hypothetical protein L9F63_014101, partial [Diploptera punctata]
DADIHQGWAEDNRCHLVSSSLNKIRILMIGNEEYSDENRQYMLMQYKLKNIPCFFFR